MTFAKILESAQRAALISNFDVLRTAPTMAFNVTLRIAPVVIDGGYTDAKAALTVDLLLRRAAFFKVVTRRYYGNDISLELTDCVLKTSEGMSRFKAD